MVPPLSRDASREVYVTQKNGIDHITTILQRRADGHVYVHYENTDKRLDEWVPESELKLVSEEGVGSEHAHAVMMGQGSLKRERDYVNPESPSASPRPSISSEIASTLADIAVPHTPQDDALMTEEEFDIQHHKQITAQRNFDKVNFGHWQIKTWYFSPYPLTESEAEEGGTPQAASSAQPAKIPGVNRATLRSHGRTSDLLAGGLGRAHLAGERSILWVCDRCFKYMSEGASWELHVKKCTRRHPPGRKVYQRGAHTIWEVDGAKDKLYCQNLSLFGKLFIDVKTLFFDCDNFLFYLLTDADSQRDYVLGFFSKEKISYDDYNLACIIVLPPYQRKGYGMLMIEFSYELSRRSGRIGTPERPLSDLGLRSYLTYWVSTLIRFFRRLLSVLPADVSQINSIGRVSDVSVLPSPSAAGGEDEEGSRARRKRLKGWDGEMADVGGGAAAPNGVREDSMAKLRTIKTVANPDGSATSHVVVKCTLADIAQATNLRVEDAAFALNECGLLVRRQTGSGEEGSEVVIVTREAVEVVAKERGVKNMCMDLAHVLL